MNIYGTYGDTVVEPYTGQPLQKITIPEYADIARFDVDEYQHFYFDEKYPVDGIDILDIGYWTEEGDYVPPDTTHRFMLQEGDAVLVTEKGPQKGELDVYSFPADHDQPITCPKCGARTDFTKTEPNRYLNTCLACACGHEFIVEFEDEEDEQESMSAGEALGLLIDYAEKDYENLDESDLDEETKAYTKRMRYAMEVGNMWLNENKDLYEFYLEMT